MEKVDGKKRNGFTLIELVVVIAILLILLAILVPNILGYVERARIAADQATVRTLNAVTPVCRFDIGKPDPFEDDSKQSVALMQMLVADDYLAQVVEPQSKDAAFLWNFQNQIWQLYIDDTPVALSPLGSSFDEITSGMIALIIQRYENKNSYGRNWGDFSYTDLGLNPDDWKDPILNIYFKPGGPNLRIRPEEGYSFIVTDAYGTERKLKSSYNWDLIYSDVNKKWYYHSIADENEIDISTLVVSIN